MTCVHHHRCIVTVGCVGVVLRFFSAVATAARKKHRITQATQRSTAMITSTANLCTSFQPETCSLYQNRASVLSCAANLRLKSTRERTFVEQESTSPPNPLGSLPSAPCAPQDDAPRSRPRPRAALPPGDSRCIAADHCTCRTFQHVRDASKLLRVVTAWNSASPVERARSDCVDDVMSRAVADDHSGTRRRAHPCFSRCEVLHYQSRVLSKILANANDAQLHQLVWFRHYLLRCLDRTRSVKPTQCDVFCQRSSSSGCLPSSYDSSSCVPLSFCPMSVVLGVDTLC